MATVGMEPGVPVRPQIFARNATGLRKEAGVLDIFVYNTDNQNIGLGVTFLLLSLAAYAGANFPLSAVLATFLVIPLYFVYSQLSADMPRSGGDYVWVTRIFGPKLGPPIGFALAWSWTVLAFTAIGVPAAFFVQLGVAGMMRSLGVATGSTTFTRFGDWLSKDLGVFIVGTILLVVFTWLLIRGMRSYMRVQNVAFFLAMAGVILGVIVALTTSTATFATHFNDYAGKLGSTVPNAYRMASAAAPAAGSAAKSTYYAMLWTLYMVLFGATSCYIGGEVRRPARTQRIGMFGSLALTGGAIALLLAVLIASMGQRFLLGLPGADSAKLGFAFLPTYNELLTIAAGGGAFWAIVLGFTFLFWTYVWMPINYLTATRLMLALSLDGYLPKPLSKVGDRYSTPHIALLVGFAMGELSLILFIKGVLTVVTVLWGGVVMFAVAGIAAMLYPYRMHDTWAASGGRKVMGIPTISIWGGLLVASMLVVLQILWSDPVVGVGHSHLQMGLNIGLPVSGLALFVVVWAFQKARGIDVRLSATEIPPE
jgi:basic amino acid/polyamine antiporter, APA family